MIYPRIYRFWHTPRSILLYCTQYVYQDIGMIGTILEFYLPQEPCFYIIDVWHVFLILLFVWLFLSGIIAFPENYMYKYYTVFNSAFSINTISLKKLLLQVVQCFWTTYWFLLCYKCLMNQHLGLNKKKYDRVENIRGYYIE